VRKVEFFILYVYKEIIKYFIKILPL